MAGTGSTGKDTISVPCVKNNRISIHLVQPAWLIRCQEFKKAATCKFGLEQLEHKFCNSCAYTKCNTGSEQIVEFSSLGRLSTLEDVRSTSWIRPEWCSQGIVANQQE